MDGAKKVIQGYFATLYQHQVLANGDQVRSSLHHLPNLSSKNLHYPCIVQKPEESARHFPYHYRAYNLHAMITNARIGAYTGLTDIWSTKSSTGGTIQNAMDYAMKFPPTTTGEPNALDEMFPIVAATKLAYGDADGKYGKFLSDNDPERLVAPYWFWDVRGADGTPVSGAANATSSGAVTTSKKGSGAQSTGGSVGIWGTVALSMGVLVLMF